VPRDFVWLRVAFRLQFRGGMKTPAWFAVVVSSGAVLSAARAHAQTSGTPTLTGADFTLTLATSDGNVMTDAELASYFSRARCACLTTVVAAVALSDNAVAALSTQTLDADLMVGNDCDNPLVTTCTPVGSLKLTSQSSNNTSVQTSTIFGTLANSNCSTVSTIPTRFWAIVHQGSARVDSPPSLALTLGGPGPSGPTDVKTVSADQGLLVSWTASGDGSTLLGHQVLCSPGASSPSDAWWDACGVPTADGGTGPFDSLDPQFVCSGLIAVGTNSARIHGLQNGTTYQIAVVAVGIDNTPSAPSAVAQGTPAPTVGFGDLYGESGGTATGCAVGGSSVERGVGLAAIGIVLVCARRWRRRRRLTLLATLVVASACARPAAAADFDILTAKTPTSERGWNVELRFGPYRPNVDSEFADRGQSARPYEEIFSNSRHLMTQLEIDHHLSHRGGTWAAGVGVGYFKVSAAALTENLLARSGDQTGLRLIPLSAVLVYRADTLRERWGSPVVPYAKVGLDCTLWQISDTSQANLDGRTFGWHAAGGVTVDLAPLDREAAGEMDRESGVNQAALFFEVARYALDGFGSGSALHVGDTTWFAGLMLEL
jgi:hypothetical protein